MEFQRRIGHGRLSEIFGSATRAAGSLPAHGRLRPRRAIARGIACPPDARRQIDAYVAGVNAFIAAHHGRLLPPEFTLLRFEPEPWTGPDVLVWVKMMAWDLSANYSLELLRHDLAARSGADRMAELLPPYPGDGLASSSRAAPPRRRRARPTSSGHRHATPPRRRRRIVVDARSRERCRAASRPCRDLLLGGATDRSARLEQLGRRRHADRQRQTAARQRPAPRHAHPVALVSGAHVRRRLRRHRRDAAGRARRRHRPQPLHRLGRDQRRRRRRRISISSG